MGLVSISGGAGGGVASDELSVTKDKVVAGQTYVGADTDDEAGIGTLPDRDAVTDAVSVAIDSTNYKVRIQNGAYRKNSDSGSPEVKGSLASLRTAIGYVNTAKVLSDTTIAGMKGTLTVSPATNFKAAQYANKTPQCTWARPSRGSMWSGIRIMWRSDRYPESPNDGNVFYEGADTYGRKYIGVNGTIYLSAWSYLTTNYGRIYSGRLTTSVYLSAASGRQVLTSSGTFTVPANVRHIKVFMIGGGASGANAIYGTHAGGGGGGYPNTVALDVSPGQTIGYAVGNKNSDTVFGSYKAAHGKRNTGDSNYPNGGDGGAGGGAQYENGGSYGGNGASHSSHTGGTGCGEAVKGPDGVYYAGGGGGGGSASSHGSGGVTGGGDGTWASASTFHGEWWNGKENTGGGGGGEGNGSQTWGEGHGGSGIIIVGWGDQEW